MNKRLLALLLVLCTILVSVPVFALPAVAAEAGEYVYSTSFDFSKFPTYGGAEPWTYADPAWGIYQYNVSNGTAPFGDASQGILINTNSAYDNAASQKTTTPAWADRVHASIGPSSSYTAMNEAGQIGISRNAAAAVRYTAEKSGIIDINIDRLANTAVTSNGTFTYSVMVNGETKWSTQVTCTAGSVKGDILTDTVVAKNVEVFAGDLIEFTMQINKEGECLLWQGAGTIFYATVNYVKEYYSTSFGADKYPVAGVYPDAAWGVYQYPATNGTAVFGDAAASALVNQNSYYAENDKLVCGPSSVGGWNDRVHFSLKEGTVSNFQAYNQADQIAVSTKAAAAVRYTAEKSGLVTIEIDRLANITTQSNGTFVYSVAINGVTKWTSGEITMTAGEAMGDIVVNTIPAELKNIEVFKGDLVEFTILATSLNADKNTWQGSGSVFFATVNYTAVYSESGYIYSSSFDFSKFPTYGGAEPWTYADPAWGIYQYNVTNGTAPFGDASQGILINTNSAFDNAASQKTTSAGWTDRVHASIGASSSYTAMNAAGQIGISRNAAAAVRYTAEKSGIIDINIDRLANTATTSNGTFTYSVMVNGETKWSTQVTCTNGSVKGDILTDTVVARNVEVVKGDLIEFTMQINKEGECLLWQGAGTIFYGSVSYKREYYTTSFNVNTLPSGSGVYPDAAWGVYNYDKVNGEAVFGAKGNSQLLDAQSGNWNAASGQIGLWTANTATAAGARTHLLLSNFNANHFSEVGQISLGSATTAAVRYTAEKSGVVAITIDRLANTAPSSAGTFTYSVYVNGERAWSIQKSTTSGSTLGNILTNTTPAELKNIEIRKGDYVEFTIETTGGDLWAGGAGSIFFGSVTYTSEHKDVEYVESTSFDTSKLPVNGVYPDAAWGIYEYPATNGAATFGDAANNALVNQSAPLNGDKSIMVKGPHGTWNQSVHLILQSFSGYGPFVEPNQIAVSKDRAAAIRYVAEKNGFIDVSIDRLANTTKESNGVFIYSVVVNGEVKWSKQTTMINGQVMGEMISNHTPTELRDLAVSKGDLVEFTIRFYRPDNGEAVVWQGSGTAFYGSVNYREVAEAPTTNASVTVGATLSSTASAILPEGASATETGLYIDGVKTVGASAAILENIAIKDIERETVTVQAYYVAENGLVVKGDAFTVSIASLLAKYENNATAAAVLNYAAAAQAYFGIDGTLKYVAPELNGEYTDNLKITNPLDDARVIPTEVALLLKDTVSFKFTFMGVEDGDKLYIKDGDKVASVEIVNGVAIIDGISADNWNTTYTFWVADENDARVSAEFTYGVSTYYARMVASDAALANLVTAMMALYETL